MAGTPTRAADPSGDFEKPGRIQTLGLDAVLTLLLAAITRGRRR